MLVSHRGKQLGDEGGSTKNNDTPDDNITDSSGNRNVKRSRANASATKNSRKKAEEVERNVPHGLMNIPVEIFMEIASFINPGDLLSVARTCKTLRETLMKHSATQIWHVAENSVLGLPNCPEDMHPPDYAALIFTKACTSCGTSTSAKVDPFLRVRLCTNCRKTWLIEASFHWKVPYLELELVSTSQMTKNKSRTSSGYCLSQDAKAILHRQDELKAVGDAEALKLWRVERHGLVESRRHFGKELNQFLSSVAGSRTEELTKIKIQRRNAVEERLRGLGWINEDWQFNWMPAYEKWATLVEHPKPLTDRIWTNLYPKLLVYLEPTRAARLKREKAKQSEARWERIHTLLQDLKPEISQFENALSKFGFDPSLPVDPSSDSSSYLSSLVDYPFPNYATAAKWPCFADVETLEPSLEELETLFNERRQDIRNEIEKWRNHGERELIEWRSQGSSNQPSEGDFTDNDNVSANKNSPANIAVLLRADTVFSTLFPGTPSGLAQPFYYPEFVPEASKYWPYRSPRNMNMARYYRHEEAETITKAILNSIGLQDATYYELVIQGAVFICDRCEDEKPKTWNKILAHYMLEKKIWTGIPRRKPIVETEYTTVPQDVHSLFQSSTPFVRLSDGEEPQVPVEPSTLNPQQTLYCLPCKNYHHAYTAENLDDMKTHLHNAHRVNHLLEGMTHKSRARGSSDLDSERFWKEEWGELWDRFFVRHSVTE